jgi:DNA polymerase-1
MSGEPRQMAADGLGHYIDDSRKTARKIMLYYNMPVEKGMSKLFKERAYIDFFIPGCETGEVKPRVSNAARIFKEKQSGFLIIHDGAENFYIYDETIAEMPEKFAAIKKILGDPSVRKSGFDFKQIFRFLKNSGLVLNGAAGDFKIQYLLLNPFMADVSIEQICSDLIENYIQGSIPEKCEVGFHEASFGAAGTQGNLGDFLSGRSIRDCLDEIKRFLLSYSVYYPVLEDLLSSRLNIENMDRLYHDIEAPLIEVLAEMENRGVNINLEYLNDLISEYEINIKALTGDIYRLCNSSFNINSPQQLAKILYQDLKLSPVKKTKTGFSTDASALFALYDMHPVIEKILDFREKVKLKNTYLDVLPNIINPDDGRVHATYNQLGTTTGRLSSNNPNMQNIPVRTELGKQIRKAFIPGMGYDLLLSADYSQIELRILAHLADDRDLIEAFNSGEDIHSKTAAEIFGVTYDGVDEGLRRKAKAINFGIIYGMTEFGLKSRLSISEEEAREYIRLYFNRYPSVKSYINSLISGAYKTGFVTTMFGRRRYIKELSSMNANIRSLGERLAVNTPIQGTAADIMKLATVNIFRKIKETGIDSNIVLHVHDEIVLEVSNKDIKRVESIVKNCMENAVQLKTELKVDLKTGRNWLLE